MKRLKSLLVAAGIAAAVVSFLRKRLDGTPAVDQGGWKPVDPT